MIHVALCHNAILSLSLSSYWFFLFCVLAELLVDLTDCLTQTMTKNSSLKASAD